MKKTMRTYKKQNGSNKIKEFMEIQKARLAVGLSLLKTGSKNCLLCSGLFFTSDMKSQHLCDYCRKEDKVDRIPKITKGTFNETN